ncbi:MAG: hypothetical protein ACR5K2_05200 [Wolbachia sp.]
MKIEHTTFQSNRDIEFLSKKISEETANKSTCNPFAFLFTMMLDKLLQAVAVLLSMVQFILICFECITIIGKGMIKQLMEKVHDYVEK